MKAVPFYVSSIIALYVMLKFGYQGASGVLIGFVWTISVLKASGIDIGWLMSLMKKIEDQGGSIFKAPPQ